MMSPAPSLETSLMQCRHRVLCGILTSVEPGKNLIERARLLGFPVDWADHRAYPNRQGYSDFGATYLLAKDVYKAEAARTCRMNGQSMNMEALDAHATRLAKEESAQIFNQLAAHGIMLSGYEQGRFYTHAQPMPWQNRASKGPTFH